MSTPSYVHTLTCPHPHMSTPSHVRPTSPCSLFLNPLRMESADVKESYSLDANEVLVVYQRERESGGVLRRVQHGPTVFTPSADEW